jgi:hypothetical protein
MTRILFLLPLFLTACPSTSPVCTLQKTVATKFSEAIATNLQCAKVDVIDADLNKALEPLKLCQAQQTGVVADIVCPTMVDLATNGGTMALPSTWECKGVTPDLKAMLTDLCKKIPY